MTDTIERAPGAVAAWTGAEEIEVLTFELNGELFALGAVLVQEITDLVAETAVPGAGGFAGSVINFRGKVIPLADLRVAFGLESRPVTIDSRIVVIEIGLGGEQALVGLRTDKVHEVTTLARADSEAPPSVGMRWRPEFIQCLVKRNGEFIVVPDLQAIFNQQQDARQPVTSTTRH
jgi:purine-binding chemotaxis protein CheW